MALDTYIVLANQYNTEADALADYEAVRKLYTDLGIIDTYDAAVLTRKPDGKVAIVKRTEEPTRQAAAGDSLSGWPSGWRLPYSRPSASAWPRERWGAAPWEPVSALSPGT